MKKVEIKNSKKYDKAGKGLIEAFQEHIIEYVTKSHPDKIEILDRELNLPHRFVDSVFKIDDKYVLNIEFQTKYEDDIEFRILLYNILLKVKYNLPVRTIVIYLTKNNENKMKNYYFANCHDTEINFKFEVIKVWELNEKEILDSKMYGMYPLLALSKKDEVLTKMLYNKILEADIEDLKKDNLINILSVLLTLIYKEENINKMFAMEKLDGLDIIIKAKNEGLTEGEQIGIQKGEQLGIEKGRFEGEQIGIQKGELLKAKNLLIRLISKKFTKISKGLTDKINKLEDLKVIENIVDNIFDLQSVKDIEQMINKA